MNSRLGVWAIDSGASDNCCNDLTEFKKDSIRKTNMIIKLGDKNEVHARKKGIVQLNRVCIEAFFVPEFRISLHSVSQLDSFGLTAIFKDGTCTTINTSTTLSVPHSIAVFISSHKSDSPKPQQQTSHDSDPLTPPNPETPVNQTRSKYGTKDWHISTTQTSNSSWIRRIRRPKPKPLGKRRDYVKPASKRNSNNT